MISINKKITRLDMSQKEIYDFMDDIFEGELLDADYDTSTIVGEYGKLFVDSAPKDPFEYIKYLSISYSRCPYSNLHGRILFKYGFTEFFSRFPLGQIWILEIDNSWNELIWKTERENKENSGVDYFGVPPYGFTGLQEENFIGMVLNFISYSIYPLYVAELIFPLSNYAICFIPDRAYKYSQMSESNAVYIHLLWKFHHVYDDQWTFDSARGPKSAADPIVFNPVNLLDFFEWYIKSLDNLLEKLISMQDEKRQQKVMTINGFMCDLFFANTSDLPFISKTFFFNMIDKASNLLSSSSEEEARVFQYILSDDFINGELAHSVESIQGLFGEEMQQTIKWVAQQIKLDGMNQYLLRGMRNIQHGFNNNPQKWTTLGGHTCEINNDITLLSTPIWLYVLQNI